ncbi:MAG: superoxide dismutase [Amoebophilaceae bacterium]|nr:superoxide dismutase [Amoebophilaceae bacterium]
MIFTLPALPYTYGALEPYIDAKTMEIHHTKHHQAYINQLNQAMVDTSLPEAFDKESLLLNQLITSISSYNQTIRNHAGGHFNHSFFWDSLTPFAPQQPHAGSQLLKAITATFGSFDAFKAAFAKAAAAHFGSGWAWLSIAKTDGRLMITATPNQDNPLMDIIPVEAQGTPILGLDVWEHAYYLCYQNNRLAYIEAFWHVINWGFVEKRFQEVTL